jgi:hypothetical protein
VVLAIFGHRICRESEGGHENFLRAAKTMRIDGRKPVFDQLINCDRRHSLGDCPKCGMVLARAWAMNLEDFFEAALVEK